MKVNKNIWTGKNKPYNRNSLYFPDGVNSGETTPAPPSDDYEYYDISQLDDEAINWVVAVSTLLKKAYVKNGVVSNIQIGNFFFAYVNQDYEKLIAMAINMAQPCIDINGARTLGEEIVNNPDTELAFIVSAIRSCPKITKEEFYSLD